MRTFSSLALAAALTVPIFGQTWQRGPYDDRGYGYGRDRYEDRGYGYGRGGDSAFGALSRVEQDLRYIASRSGGGYYGRGDDSRGRRSIEKALNDVTRVQDSLRRNGRLDTGRLNNASNHIADALRDGRMDPRDRSTLSRAISMLQSVRSGGYGANGPWRR